MLSSRTLPTQRGALNKLKTIRWKYLAVFIVFLVIFFALHQYYIICRLKYLASQHKPTNITFNQSMSLKQEEKRRCWIMCYFYYLLLVPFYTVFCVTKILALTEVQSPTCPTKPEPRVATLTCPLPRPLYFWYLFLSSLNTYIVVTVYCPCESIKHQVVEWCIHSVILVESMMCTIRKVAEAVSENVI